MAVPKPFQVRIYTSMTDCSHASVSSNHATQAEAEAAGLQLLLDGEICVEVYDTTPDEVPIEE